ncbi:2778_t:CDS:2, partial [Diversispora eburnea]
MSQGTKMLKCCPEENGIKDRWNFIKQDWEYDIIGVKVALKEMKDSRYTTEFLKVNINYNGFIAMYYGFSKNPFTQNYIFVADLFHDDFHNYLTKTFWDLEWQTKTNILASIAEDLESLHSKNLVHCDLRSGNIFITYNEDLYFEIDLGLCKLENDLILNYNPKNNETYGSIPYIPPE